MAVNPVSTPIDLIASNSSNSNKIQQQSNKVQQQQQEQNEVHQASRDATPDNDKDDQTTKANGPTVNTSGQTIGTIVNAKA